MNCRLVAESAYGCLAVREPSGAAELVCGANGSSRKL